MGQFIVNVRITHCKCEVAEHYELASTVSTKLSPTSALLNLQVDNTTTNSHIADFYNRIKANSSYASSVY
jgi:hypothetical protein